MSTEGLSPAAAQLFTTVKTLREGKVNTPVKGLVPDSLRIPNVFTRTQEEYTAQMINGLPSLVVTALVLTMRMGFEVSTIFDLSGVLSTLSTPARFFVSGVFFVDVVSSFVDLRNHFQHWYSSFNAPKEQSYAHQIYAQLKTQLGEGNPVGERKLNKLFGDAVFYMSKYRQKYSREDLNNALQLELAAFNINGSRVVLTHNPAPLKVIPV